MFVRPDNRFKNCNNTQLLNKHLPFRFIINVITLMMNGLHLLIGLLLALCIHECTAIWCYQCNSAIPGCMEPFNWMGIGYLGNPCPDSEDICVKLIERKGAQKTITRDCLSNFRAFRTDIPADTYEGCRAAAKDVNLANYVNNTIKELDIKRDWFDETTWCFCFLDHRCNSATMSNSSILTIFIYLLYKVLF